MNNNERKLMKIDRLLFVFISLMLPALLCADNFCAAPAPASGQVIEQSNDFASLDWDAVPGALSYQVTTIDADNGGVVAQVIVNGTSHTQGNLIAGNDYEIEVSSSYCATGPYGEPLVFNVRTDIVIVDIILQMECIEEINPTEDPVIAGDETVLEMNSNGCYRVELETEVTGETKTVEVGLKLSANGQLMAGNLANNPSEFEMVGSGPVLGRFSSGGDNIQLFSLSMNQQGPQYRAINFEWLSSAFISVNFCTHCEFIYEDERKDLLRIEEEQAQDLTIKMHPNPVNSLLQLQIPQEGQLQIYDLTGKQWYHANADGDNQLALDVSAWPSGAYILRWHQADLPPLVQYFLKH